MRSSVLRLPPELRSVTLQSRAFSSTPSRKSPLLDLTLAGPSAIINGIHNLGIPWYATLPLTAVLVRGIIVYYLASLPARKKAQTKALLFPLITAKADSLMAGKYHEEVRDMRELPGPQMARNLTYNWIQLKAKFAAMEEIGKPFKAPVFTGRSLINFGVLISFTEVIRLKCGSREGLLPLILRPFEWIAQTLDPQNVPKAVEPEVKDSAAVLAERTEAVRNQQEAVINTQIQPAPGYSRASEILNGQSDEAAFQSGSTADLSPLSSMDVSSYIDSSLRTEGLAWFTNLTVPDSTLLFPAALSATMLITVILRPTVGKRSTSAKKPQNEDSSPPTNENPPRPTHSLSEATILWAP